MGVAPACSDDQSLARDLAARLGVPLLTTGIAPLDLEPGSLLLSVTAGMPQVLLTGRGAPGPVAVDFASKAMASRRRAGHNELLGRAVGWKAARSPVILDATGGFGRDAFLLADLGCEVLISERQPVMALLLQLALERALESDDPWLVTVCRRMRLHAGDARVLPARELEYCDVVYLDPMFPLDRRAAPAKEMQILHRLVAASEGEDSAGAGGAELLDWALAQPVPRVVVKRPRRAPALPGPAPGHTLQGRSVRFDVYHRGDARSDRQGDSGAAPPSRGR